MYADVFANDLPVQALNILLNDAWLRCRKPNNDLEEVPAICFSLRYSKRLETFRCDFFFDSEAHSDQRLQEVDGIHACDEALNFTFPENTANENAVWCPFLRGGRLEIGIDDDEACLGLFEPHQTTLGFTFRFSLAFGHGVQIAICFKIALV